MALGKVHGEFAPRALRLVLEWAELHEAECLRIGNYLRDGQHTKLRRRLETEREWPGRRAARG